MSWSQALLALLVSHAVGDVLLQTEWQAQTKGRGLADPLGRRALARHIATYMLAFVPALVWVAAEVGVLRALAVAGVVAISHLIIDDGRVVSAWLREIKHSRRPPPALAIAVDQTLHVVCLLAAALVAAS